MAAIGVAALSNGIDTSEYPDLAILKLKLQVLNSLGEQGNQALNHMANILEALAPDNSNTQPTDLETVFVSGPPSVYSNFLQINKDTGEVQVSYGSVRYEDHGNGQQLINYFNVESGEVHTLIYNADGTKTILYPDASSPDGTSSYTFTNVSDITIDAAKDSVVTFIGESTSQFKTFGKEFVAEHPDILNDPASANALPDEYADARVGMFWELHERAKTSGTVSVNANGNTEYMLSSGVYLEAVNTGDPSKTVELIKVSGFTKPVGVVTNYGGSFQQHSLGH